MGLIINRNLALGLKQRVLHPNICRWLDKLFNPAIARGGSYKNIYAAKLASSLRKTTPEQAARLLAVGIEKLVELDVTERENNHIALVIDAFEDANFALNVAKALIAWNPKAIEFLLHTTKYKQQIKDTRTKKPQIATGSVKVAALKIHALANKNYSTPNELYTALDEICRSCMIEAQDGSGKRYNMKALNANLSVIKQNNPRFINIINNYIREIQKGQY